MLFLYKTAYLSDELGWEHLVGIFSALVALAAVVLGAYLTYYFAIPQLKRAHRQAIRQHRQVHKLALQQDELMHKRTLHQEEVVHQLAVRQQEQTQVLAHQNTVEQNRMTHNIVVKSDRLQREITALEAVWELLVYMTQRKNDKAIIHWLTKRDEKGNKTKTYSFNYQNLEDFMFKEISRVVYQQHAGLFISKEVRDLLNGYRSVAGEFYFAHHRSKSEIPEDGLILINSPAKAKVLEDIYNELNALLRTELKKLWLFRISREDHKM